MTSRMEGGGFEGSVGEQGLVQKHRTAMKERGEGEGRGERKERGRGRGSGSGSGDS